MLKDELPCIVTQTLPGPKSAALIARRREVVPDAIGCRYPVAIARGEGAMVEDLDGNRFLDWVGGVGVLNIGYSQPEVVAAVQEQAGRYFHSMQNIMTHEGYIDLAEKVCELAPVAGGKKRAFFANSGSEANENAVKVAKAFTGRPNTIVFSGAFHGRTLLTMAMTSKKSYAVGMGPLPEGVFRARFPYLYRKPAGMGDEEAIDLSVASIEDVFEECAPADTVAALVVEPLQGEGGFIPAPIEWVKKVRRICDENGILLVVDEVQSGFCRTGRMFASEYWAEAGVRPDILTFAKSVAGGVPLSGVVARDEVMQAPAPGTIGGTFGGNALACAAALKVIEVMQRDHLADRSLEIGAKVCERYARLKDRYECVGDYRGLGGMVGLELVESKAGREPATELCGRVIDECARTGLIVEGCGTYNNCIRFLAPLVITDEQLACGLDILEAAIAKESGE